MEYNADPNIQDKVQWKSCVIYNGGHYEYEVAG